MTETLKSVSAKSLPQDRKIIAFWLFVMAALVAIMVVIGGLTRLTGSGLSMVEWRPLLGTLPPLSNAEWERVFSLYKLSPEYEHYNFGMSLNEFKTIFFWEYFHRLWGRLLGITFGVPYFVLLLTKRLPIGYTIRLTCLFFLGGIQGLIGWWMVKSGLTEDASVSQYRLAVHLTIALIVFSILLWTGFDLYYRSRVFPKGSSIIVLMFISITIIAGALVAGMDAGLLYNEYPLMGVSMIPIEYGDIGLWDPFENPASAQFHHRWVATITVVAVLAYCIRAWHAGVKMLSLIVTAAVVVQFLLGIFTLLNGVPVVLGGLHQAGAIFLLSSTLALAHQLHR